MIDFAMVDFGEKEREAVNRVMMGTSLASGKECEAFEREFSEYVGAKYAVLCNSGSSANLLALASLNLPKGSAVLTSACGFPATLSPILHLRLTPILVDYREATQNIDVEQVLKHMKSARALILAHTLGNPVDMERIISEANKHGVAIIEDCCEAVGTKVGEKHVGTFGHLGTYSFYPAHQITALGGGGMVVTDSEELYQNMKSLRDWGKMYDWDSGLGGVQTTYDSPIGYHRGYTYETVGWNFKLPEANAAFGRVQLGRLNAFRERRYENWTYLYERIKTIDEIYTPKMPEGSCPFGFSMMLSKPGRNGLGLFLEKEGIKHRPFFAGNILRQPAFMSAKASSFPVADKLMQRAMFVGCHTKMSKEDLQYIVRKVTAYVLEYLHS